MRRFSCFDAAALLAAAGIGFLAGERSHRQDPVNIRISDSVGELSDAPPTALAPPQPVEEIDLTCQSNGPMALRPQTAEPPLADDPANSIRTVSFELPAGAPSGSDLLSTMPYLTDDPSPGLLPPLGDVPLLLPPAPVTPSSSPPNAANPIFQAAKRFVSDGAVLPTATPDPNARMNALINESENERSGGADWRRFWMNDAPTTYGPITDRVPIGKPPVSEHPSTAKPEKPKSPPPPKADTTEIRPGDVPSKPNGD